MQTRSPNHTNFLRISRKHFKIASNQRLYAYVCISHLNKRREFSKLNAKLNDACLIETSPGMGKLSSNNSGSRCTLNDAASSCAELSLENPYRRMPRRDGASVARIVQNVTYR